VVEGAESEDEKETDKSFTRNRLIQELELDESAGDTVVEHEGEVEGEVEGDESESSGRITAVKNSLKDDLIGEL